MKRPEPVTGTAAMFVRITRNRRSTLYRVVPLPTDPAVANLAWRLTKSDRTSYEVHVDGRGAHCTCRDFIVRRENVDRHGCKHIAACRSLGLLRPIRVSRKGV